MWTNETNATYMSHICKFGKGRRPCHDISELISNEDADVIACSRLSDRGKKRESKRLSTVFSRFTFVFALSQQTFFQIRRPY